MAAIQPMSPGDDHAGALWRELRSELSRLASEVERMSRAVDRQAALVERTETNRREIDRLRRSIDEPDGALDRLAKLENGEAPDLMPWKLLIAIIGAIATVVSAIVTAAAMVVVG